MNDEKNNKNNINNNNNNNNNNNEENIINNDIDKNSDKNYRVKYSKFIPLLHIQPDNSSEKNNNNNNDINKNKLNIDINNNNINNNNNNNSNEEEKWITENEKDMKEINVINYQTEIANINQKLNDKLNNFLMVKQINNNNNNNNNNNKLYEQNLNNYLEENINNKIQFQNKLNTHNILSKEYEEIKKSILNKNENYNNIIANNIINKNFNIINNNVNNNNNNTINNNLSEEVLKEQRFKFDDSLVKELPSIDYLHRVQQAIEFLLLFSLAKEQIIKQLRIQMKVKEIYSEIVWAHMERENASFFAAYNLRLQIRDQILAMEFLYAKIKENKKDPKNVNLINKQINN